MEPVKELIQIENLQVEIWRRSYQRSLNLRVHQNGLVRVTCGQRVARREVERFVRESSEFIVKRQREIARRRELHPEKKFQSGETFLLFGESVSLEVIWTWTKKPRLSWQDGRLEMTAPLAGSCEDRRKAFREYLRKLARPHLERRLKHFSQLTGLKFKKFRVSGARSRWGSCSTKGTIGLNWKLMAAPHWVIDYVIIHELVHTRHFDHSPRFWQLVEEYFPERKTATGWLREHEAELAAQFA